ncbi:response regulator transcription factor [Luteolibacter sp. SL250]|uniref:response regulator n=1 Tax=Luteolibacter sp. SL250 TaxID=2995170 RepID=UPI00226F2FC6|nr:response regulator transcription factor [Luteolibacter sp. SL250]WAC20882.1 response regulator transcription factor [Luteolibacter sp. SL250]
MSEPTKTVVLVEDDVRLQKQLIEILSCSHDIECLYAVSSAEEALEKIPSHPPDVILMDINLPGASGIDCIPELKRKLPGLEIVMLTAYEEEDNLFRALKAGASGYLIKSSDPREIYDAIRDVQNGGAPFSSHIARKVVQYFRAEKKTEDENARLSTREREVLEMLAGGYIYKEVADKLDITVETVRTYVKRICVKLQVRSKVEAILKYRS